MEVRLLTVGDKAYIESIALLHNIDNSMAMALVSNNGGLVLVDKGKLLAGSIGHVSVSTDAKGTMYKCIGISGSVENAKKLLVYLDSVFLYSVLTESCMDFVKAKYKKGSGEWYRYMFNAECDFTKVGNKKIAEMYMSVDAINLANKAIACREILDGNKRDSNTYFSESEQILVADVESLLIKHCDGVWSLPAINRKMVDRLIAFGNKNGYKVNDYEEYSVQIPEVVLSEYSEDLDNTCADIFKTLVRPLSKILYMKEVEEITSIQLAKYTKDTTVEGSWHFDASSDITFVINLSNDVTDEGTKVKLFGSSEVITIPPLEPGYGLLFRGRMFMHKGCKTNSERNLLVFWTN